MASLTRHRARAVLSSLVDGLLVGGAEAVLELPARSRQRAAGYAGLMTVTGLDAVVPEIPTLRRALHGLEPEPTLPAERTATLHSGLVCLTWGLAVTVADGPAVRALGRRGVQRPHVLLGVLVGVATAVSTLPIWWARATARAAADEASDDLDRELAELIAGAGP